MPVASAARDTGEAPGAAGSDGSLPIGQVAQLLGVPMPTLRSWERRYAIPHGSRPTGQHRRYSGAELRAVQLMRDEIAQGKRAGVAAQSVRSQLGLAGPAAPFLAGFLAASATSDPAAVRAQLEVAGLRLGLGGCIDDVLFPAMRQIGLRWSTAQCDVDEERLTTETARAWLDRLTAFAPPPIHPDPVVLACGPGDQHTLGLESLGVLLRYRRHACWMLGARTTARDLGTAVRASGASAVVLACHLAHSRARAVRSLAAVHEQGVAVFYAGDAFVSPHHRRGLPGTYLGARVQDACALIDDLLGSGPAEKAS